MPHRPLRIAPRRANAAGFTLLELLVAISVLALVSIIAWRGLESLVATRERLEPAADDVRALLVTFGQMERDLAQVVDPRFVPLDGNVIDSRGGTEPGFELMRRAPAVEGEATRVERVSYRLIQGQLVRQSTAPTRELGQDNAAGVSTAVLLGGVRSLRLRYWQPGAGWIEPAAFTPAAGTPAGTNPDGTPIASASAGRPAGVEVTIERDDGTPFRRVLLVG
jgi:general secretion pathway protein J